MKKDNRTLIFSSALVTIFCCGAISVFSVFVKTLQEATGGTSSQVLLTLTINQIFMAGFGIISGKIVDKIGPRLVMMVGGAIFGAGWTLTAYVSSIPMLYLVTGVVVGIGNGLIYNPTLNTALKWFPEKKGTISGVLLCVTSAGSFTLAKVGAILCESMGQKGFMVFGLFFLVASVIAASFMKAPSQDFMASGVSANATNTSTVKDLSSQEMLKTSVFWNMFILFIFASTAGIMMVGSLSTIAQTQLSITALEASNLVAINALANLVGRLAIGKLSDKIGAEKTLAMILILTAISLIGLKVAMSSYMLFTLFLIILSASFGGVLVVFPPLTASKFGMKYQGMNYGIMFFAYAIGSLVGPQIAANFVNLDLGTQAYANVYVVAAVVALLGLACTYMLMKKTKKEG